MPALPGRNRVLVVGESLVDLAPRAAGGVRGGTALDGARQAAQDLVAMPGGSPANVAVGLARLDIPTSFAGRLSSHGLGPWLRSHLAANGVDVGLSVEADEPATLALVTLDQDGGATYGFYGPETADWQWRAEELPPAGQLGQGGLGIAVVHTGSLATALPPGSEVVAAWLADVRRSGDVVVSFDPNVRPGLAGDFEQQRRRLTTTAASAHVVKASHEDVAALLPGTDAHSAAQQWLAGGAVLVVITEGSKGATVVHRDGFEVHGAPPAVTVADTIGAGDSFMSGLLAHLARQGLLTPDGLTGAGQAEVGAALKYALAASALTCTRPGADPPTTEELEKYLSGP